MSFACMRLVALPDPASSRRLPPPLLVAVRQQWVLAVLKYHRQWRRLSYLKRRRLVCYFRAQVIALRRPTTVRAVLAARQQWFVMDLKNWLASSTPTQDLLRRMLALPSCWAHSGTVAITLALHELDGFERLPQRACWLQRLWWLQRLHDEARGPSAKPQGCVPACPRDDHSGKEDKEDRAPFPRGAELAAVSSRLHPQPQSLIGRLRTPRSTQVLPGQAGASHPPPALQTTVSSSQRTAPHPPRSTRVKSVLSFLRKIVIGETDPPPPVVGWKKRYQIDGT